ncbi:Uncharacterised protein [Vibrio cholerae]|nr:Uncharacterised protein [Vibrio cholerae]
MVNILWLIEVECCVIGFNILARDIHVIGFWHAGDAAQNTFG